MNRFGNLSKRVAGAFLLAPLAAALLSATISALDGGFTGGFGEMLVTAAIGYLYAGAVTAALALPAFLIFRRFDYVRWWVALTTGAAVGFLFALVIGTPSAPILRGRLPLTAIGMTSGLVFWLIARGGTTPKARWAGP
jgi:hypothetical protein